ncbi:MULTISPECIES: D-amino acid dehydrogenase [unclassified Moraxella]|uniref:D-amino acid dehydrogenase n=1 Tax=unclassified Moraxella TaxID=2685852 RepID=UPI003AF43140
MSKHIIVLGGGVVGVTTAWQLSKAGLEVTLIERESEVALQTSFANGGQISVCHATPWANPSTPIKAMKWLWREDAPLLFRWQRLIGREFDRELWRWGWQFLRECTAKNADANLVQMVNLGLYSRAVLGEVRAETGIDYDCLTKGIMHFYTSEAEFATAIAPTERMQQLGCDRRLISVAEAVGLEPALANIEAKLVGATYTALDESGDAKLFTQALAKQCQQRGVRFLLSHQIERLVYQRQQIMSVQVTDLTTQQTHHLSADGYVLALGSYSPLLAKPLGVDLPIYPAKGYSATYPVLKPNQTPYVSLIDDEYKLVYSRLGNRLRVAGTAEFNGFNLSLNPIRCQAITQRVGAVFGDAVDLAQPNYWTGLRPMTPSNVPIIGRAVNRQGVIDNLYLNTGHGTLGWTHSNGSAKAITDIILGKTPNVDFGFVGV